MLQLPSEQKCLLNFLAFSNNLAVLEGLKAAVILGILYSELLSENKHYYYPIQLIYD